MPGGGWFAGFDDGMKNVKIDYEALRRKFPSKNPDRRRRIASIKAIRREYETKRSELGLKAPVFRRGPAFYLVLVIGLALLGALVLSVAGKGGRAQGPKRADIKARESMNALCIALGRYKFHVGRYPTDEEGLAALAAITPEKRGWFGPYIRKLNPDPWGRAYVYETRPEGGDPVLYSRGPDGRMGTTDDVMPDRKLFREPFENVAWTNKWVPYQLRGYVLAPDEAARKRIQEAIDKY